MTRGPKPGTKFGPRPGSRPWALVNMKPGERLIFEANAAGASVLMQQISTDIQRNGLKGLRKQRLALAVLPDTKELIELVFVEFV